MTPQTKTRNAFLGTKKPTDEKPTDDAGFFPVDHFPGGHNDYNDVGDRVLNRNPLREQSHESRRRQKSVHIDVDIEVDTDVEPGGMTMMIREPVVAGRFYAQDERKCRADLAQCLTDAAAPELEPAALVGGLVPHAGWVCSGAVAAKLFTALSAADQGTTVVLLGAVHRPISSAGAVFPRGAWQSPLGRVDVDDRLADRLLAATNLLQPDPQSHEPEHSIEVQIPFIQQLMPDAKILPIMVPPSDHAAALGRIIGRTIQDARTPAFVVASSDLTHYGPSYGFLPAGDGAEGIRWAKENNDRRILDLILAMQADQVVPEATEHKNACGSGAIAAAIAACQQLGATRGILLDHTNSHEVLRDRYPEAGDDAVGYAAIAFSK